MLLRHLVEQELVDHFPGLKNTPVLHDFGKIGEFLSSKQQVNEYLALLEADMLQELKSRVNDPTISNSRHIEGAHDYFVNWESRQKEREQAVAQNKGPIDPRTSYDKRYTQLLATVLRRQEAKHGLNPSIGTQAELPLGDGKVYMAGIASPKVFSSLLSRYIFFKDVGAHPGHGEYSHRIQWYLITRRFPGMAFTKLLDVIASSPMVTHKAHKDINVGIWDCLFDRRAVMEEKPFDGRSPVVINLHIIDRPNKFPLLSSFCGRRKIKRERMLDAFFFKFNQAKQDSSQDWVTRAKKYLPKSGGADPGLQYVALKIFGKNFWDLSEARQTEILEHFHAQDPIVGPA